MKEYYLIVIAVFIGWRACGQSVYTGQIRDNKGEVVTDVSVVLMLPSDSTIAAYCFSNGEGYYTIRYEGDAPEILLSVYGFNIRRQIKRVTNKSQRVDFTVNEGAIELREVSIKSEKIWGGRDTINYVVDAFRDTTDLVIGDVLKKLPGVEVLENGHINYRGKPIKKFYIENMDMLQGRYGLATNNISASDIATVQVFENHQPVKALHDVMFTDDAAINLKLKEGAKGVFSIMATLGGGYDSSLLWNEAITGMFFGKTKQHLAIYKTNNTGDDVWRELQSFTSESMSNTSPITYMVVPSPPDIQKQHYYFNNTHGTSVSTLRKTNDSSELTVTLHGMHDDETRKSGSKTTFFIPQADTISISERLLSNSTSDKLSCDLGLMRNKSFNYLKASINFSGDWHHATGSVFNDSTVEQGYNLNTLRAMSFVHWVRKGRKNERFGTELNSRTWFQSQPCQLTVRPGMFTAVMNQNKPYGVVNQDVVMNSFETRNSLMFLSSVVWKSLHIHPVFLFSLQNQSLSTNLSKSDIDDVIIKIPGDTLVNDLKWLCSKTGMSIAITYRSRDFNFELSTPVQHQFVSLTDDNKRQNSFRHALLFQPYLRLRYSLGNRWEASGSWYGYNQNPDLTTLYSGYVVQNYRSLSRYDSKLSDSYGNGVTLKLSYKDIMGFLFTSLEVNYNRYHGDVMYAQKFDGWVLKTTAVEMANKGDYLSLTGRASKGFDWEKLSFNFEGSLGWGNTPQLRQGKLFQYNSRGLNTNLSGSMALSDALLLANKCSWSYVTGSMGNEGEMAAITNFINAANIDVIFSDAVYLSASFEFCSTQNGIRRQNFFLIDAGFTFTRKHVRFTLDWSNLLNTKKYVYSYYNSLNSYLSEYTIRPASVLLKVQFKLY